MTTKYKNPVNLNTKDSLESELISVDSQEKLICFQIWCQKIVSFDPQINTLVSDLYSNYKSFILELINTNNSLINNPKNLRLTRAEFLGLLKNKLIKNMRINNHDKCVTRLIKRTSKGTVLLGTFIQLDQVTKLKSYLLSCK